MPVRPLDSTDRRLLDLLVRDSAQPLKSLAATVGLSASSVRERIERLKATGVIRRFTIEVAVDGEVRAILQLRLHRTPDPEVVHAVCNEPHALRCYSLSGPIDLLVELAAPSVVEINAARDQIASLPGVASVETSLVLNRDKSPG